LFTFLQLADEVQVGATAVNNAEIQASGKEASFIRKHIKCRECAIFVEDLTTPEDKYVSNTFFILIFCECKV
jgi:hypothetical protein